MTSSLFTVFQFLVVATVLRFVSNIALFSFVLAYPFGQ